MSLYPKWLPATRHAKKKHGLDTCDGSAPHGAMSSSMSTRCHPTPTHCCWHLTSGRCCSGTSPPASAAGTTRPFIAAPPNPPRPAPPQPSRAVAPARAPNPVPTSAPQTLVSALVRHVMHQGPYNVQFGGAWHTIPHEPREFAGRGRFDTARHLFPMCGQMSLRWEIYNLTSGRIWIRCLQFRRHGCTFQCGIHRVISEVVRE